MGRADVYLQPDAKDPVLSEATVLDIARAHTDVAAGPVEVDESGGEARAYLLAGDVVVKTQRPHRLRPRTSLAKEAQLLTQTAASLGDRIPTLFGYGHQDTADGEIEYLVMSRMPGRATRHLSVTGPARTALLHELGALLARLHAQDTAVFTADGLFPTDTGGADLARRLDTGFADLGDLLAERPGAWTLPLTLDEVAVKTLAMLPETFAPVVLHSNPGPTHVFADDNGVFTGLIDFGDAYLSHPALDLRSWPDPADRFTLRDGYLDAVTPAADFDAAWTAAMIYTDVAVLASRPELADAAAADLTARLAGR